MPKPLTPRQRLDQAREYILKAREFPEPVGLGYRDLAFIAQVKDLLRQARDMVKFLQYSPSLSKDLQIEARATLDAIITAEKEILHK